MRKSRLDCPGLSLLRDSPSPLGHPISPTWAEVEGRGEESNARNLPTSVPRARRRNWAPQQVQRKVIDVQNAQKQVSREPAGCQVGGWPGAPGRAVPRWGCHGGQEGPGASWRNRAQKVTLRSVLLALGKREASRLLWSPVSPDVKETHEMCKTFWKKKPAPVRVRCRVITDLSQESWGQRLLRTVPPRDPESPE